MSSFSRSWIRQKTPTGIVHRPVLDLLFKEKRGYNLYSFIVDSGADISLAPRELAERIGVDWAKGKRAGSPEYHLSRSALSTVEFTLSELLFLTSPTS